MPTTKGTLAPRRSKRRTTRQDPMLIKLDIACGQRKQEGFVGIDWAEIPSVDIVHDLTQYPWPIEDESVGQAFCSHYIEHIPLADLPTGQDHLLAFFDELYRILTPGGQALVIAPYYSSMRAWQDPTHRRAISEATFLYANKDWRIANGLDHYRVSCDFDFAYSYIVDNTWATRNEETRAFAFRYYLNAISDIQVTMTKRA